MGVDHRLLAARGALEIIEPDAVNARAVTTAADRAVTRVADGADAGSRAPDSGLDLGGAQNSAAILKDALKSAQDRR